MRVFRAPVLPTVLGVLLVLPFAAARGEVVDEIVAKVNDDIITRSEFEAAEQESVAEAYRRLSGQELDREVERMRQELLREMINRKVLLHRATRMYDVDKLGSALIDSFLEREGIANRDELARLLAAENLTEDDLEKRLIEMYAPQEVETYEVRSRVSVSEAEIRGAYDAEPDRFRVAAEATVREIVILSAERGRAAALELAQAARARATAPGADFGAIASEVSDAGTKAQGGLLGVVRRGDLAPALEARAFGLPVGEVSPLIEAEYGFHLVKVDSRTDDAKQPFDEVKESIRREIWSRRYQDLYMAFMKRAWEEAEIWVSPKYAARLSKP
jgi:peptidyl-prolyl cis-trans isomerase SurA